RALRARGQGQVVGIEQLRERPRPFGRQAPTHPACFLRTLDLHGADLDDGLHGRTTGHDSTCERFWVHGRTGSRGRDVAGRVMPDTPVWMRRLADSVVRLPVCDRSSVTGAAGRAFDAPNLVRRSRRPSFSNMTRYLLARAWIWLGSTGEPSRFS